MATQSFQSNPALVNPSIMDVFMPVFPGTYDPSVKPTEETKLQPHRWQDRSKYLGDGTVRTEEVKEKVESTDE